MRFKSSFLANAHAHIYISHRQKGSQYYLASGTMPTIDENTFKQLH